MLITQKLVIFNGFEFGSSNLKKHNVRLLTGNIHENHQVITHMKGTEGWEGDLP